VIFLCESERERREEKRRETGGEICDVPERLLSDTYSLDQEPPKLLLLLTGAGLSSKPRLELENRRAISGCALPFLSFEFKYVCLGCELVCANDWHKLSHVLPPSPGPTLGSRSLRSVLSTIFSTQTSAESFTGEPLQPRLAVAGARERKELCLAALTGPDERLPRSLSKSASAMLSPCTPG